MKASNMEQKKISEISREKAIGIIELLPLYRYECELDIRTHSDIFEALNKAISDMQKMEKIEKRIAEFRNGTDMFKGMDEAYVVFAIEDILKEV